MSELRKLIARMDQLNEAGPVMTPQTQADIRSQADYGGEPDDAKDDKGNLTRSTSPGLGGSIDVGGVSIPDAAVDAGLGSVAAMGGIKNAGKSYKPAPPLKTTGEPARVGTTTPTSISGTADKVPGKVSVTPDTGRMPKTLDQRRQAAADLNKKMDQLQAQQGSQTKPAVWSKRGDANFDPNMSTKGSMKGQTSPVDANVKPDSAVSSYNPNTNTWSQGSDPAIKPAVKTTGEPPKINRDDLGRELDDLGRPSRTLGGDPINYGPAPAPSTASTSTSTTVANTDKPTQLNPFRGPAPEPSVYGPGGIKNFRRDAPVQPDPSKFGGEESAAYKLAKDKYNQQVNPPGKFATGLATAAALGSGYVPGVPGVADLAREYPNLTTAVVGKDPFNLMKNQPPADNADTTQTKESLQNKLFKEFRTFVEKR